MELDRFSYRCGVIDCFNEMVRAGLKPMALAHPCPTRAQQWQVMYKTSPVPQIADNQCLRSGDYIWFRRCTSRQDAGYSDDRRTISSRPA